jgi:hypothetical protein
MRHHGPTRIAASLVVACSLIGCTPAPNLNQVFETYVTDLPPRVRVTSHPDKSLYAAGTFYRFEVLPVGAEHWREVTTFLHDDAIPIPREQMRRVTDQIAYFFIGWTCAVTADGGQTWAVWTAARDLPNWQCCNYRLIRDMTIREDGSGTMLCDTLEGHSGEVPRLETADFGHTWQPKRDLTNR